MSEAAAPGSTLPASAAATLHVVDGPAGRHATAAGRWTVAAIDRVDREIARRLQANVPTVLDLGAVTAMDGAGAWLVVRTERHFARAGVPFRVDAGPHAPILALLRQIPEEPTVGVRRHWQVTRLVGDIGQATIELAEIAYSFAGFLGLTLTVAVRTLWRPRDLRWSSLSVAIERAGLAALPIVGLLSFLVGVVLAYQSADQLRRFGAESISVNVLGISVLREFGVLIAAIIVAGRSASAFCAQIGSMKVSQEVDALRTLGLDPMVVLVLPRVIGLVLVMPLLAFWADVTAIAGGITFLSLAFDETPRQLLTQMKSAVTVNGYLVGIVKAPFFGVVIALVGCLKGLQVEGGADAVGRNTTAAVVQSIFLVIVLDAGFSILFSVLGI